MTAQQPATESSDMFVCPRCKGILESRTQSYYCSPCERDYPILFGIPDFRLRSDRYLSIEQERAKAEKIATIPKHNFSAMLDYYYQITDDVPAELAVRYKAYHHNGPLQAAHSIDTLSIHAQDYLLDVGCGTGGSLIAAANKTTQLVGVDIALRWLVICKQRLNEQGVKALLVCADAEALPFPNNSFNKIMASDLLENVYDVDKALVSLSQQLQTGGTLWLSGSNKFCLGPHPTTRIWAVAYFPPVIRSYIVKKLRGVDSLRFIQLISPGNILQLANQLGLQASKLSPKMVSIEAIDQYPWIDQVLIRAYSRMANMAFFQKILLWIGPAFEMALYKPADRQDNKDIGPL